jgi:DNA-binding HxlR family transcriptional regulator
MNRESGIARKEYNDGRVLKMLDRVGQPIVELSRSTGLSTHALKSSLVRLMDEGRVVRTYEGNARFGRHLYSVK